jgi:L-ascorbate 6-phosphate lactonase
MPQTPALQKGAALQADIRATETKPGQAALWWLGQATFAIKLGKTLIYTDPFYRAENEEPYSMQEMPLKASEFTNADIIVGTHEHLDHIDPKTFPGAVSASPDAKVIIGTHNREFVVKSGVPAARLTCLRGDDKTDHKDITVHAVPAAHMELDHSEQLGFRYLGYVFQGNGVTLYHTGDTQPYPGWAERVNKFKLDIALLPISGVDNFYWQQAVYFCCIHQPRLAIPIHYGMFKGYSEDPQVFAQGILRNAPKQEIKILKVGEKFIFG